ncbi:MAG: hypothetical protein ACFE9T_16655 [Promethearchaeota archaeon]
MFQKYSPENGDIAFYRFVSGEVWARDGANNVALTPILNDT